ncbi:MAG TPA: hypothetical protein VGR16_09690, partial [Thermomicrobiales bacterium]|nr:hypothetical protein [Thermomicrobiales bacterium]
MAQKIATPAKWTELFSKAVRETVNVRQLGSGAWIATSGTDRRSAYVVSLDECECPGHEYHGYCKHRAMLAWTLGVLTIGAPEPEPPTPAAPAARRTPFNLSDAEMVAAKADAMRQHIYHGA